MSNDSSTRQTGLTPVQWLICLIAAIGFTFDTYEILMLPLVLEPTLTALGVPRTIEGAMNPEYKMWLTWVLFLPAVLGGIFGLLGGYLTDLVGRRRMLTFSIMLYALSALASGFSTTPVMLLFFRCLTFIGVCLEFVAATAWLAELFDDPKRRERVLGYTQAFGSMGGVLVAYMNLWLVGLEEAGTLPALALPEWLNVFGGSMADPNGAWRFTLMSGLIPALPLIIIRPFLPESPEWQRKKDAGTLGRPSLAALFTPALRRTTIVTTLMVALSFGAAFGAILHMPRMIRGIPAVQNELAQLTEQAESEGWSAAVLKEKRANAVQTHAASVSSWQEKGGILGRIFLAFLAVRIVSRRKLIWIFLIPGLVMMPITFGYAAVHNLDLLFICMFLVAFFTIGQFSFWGNYLPRVFPVHLRGTGESCAANIGGRMIGTSFWAVVVALSSTAWLPGDDPATKLAYAAAVVGTSVFSLALVLSFWLPEPSDDESLVEPTPEGSASQPVAV